MRSGFYGIVSKREVNKKDIEIIDLDRNMILDRTVRQKLIHVADPT